MILLSFRIELFRVTRTQQYAPTPVNQYDFHHYRAPIAYVTLLKYTYAIEIIIMICYSSSHSLYKYMSMYMYA